MQFVIGFLMVAHNIFVLTIMLLIEHNFLNRHPIPSRPFHFRVVKYTLLCFWYFLGHVLNIACWTILFYLTRAGGGVYEAIICSSEAYTTLGSHCTIRDAFSLLPGFCGMSGFTMFGLSTAFIFDQVRRTRRNI